jgi:hypothetical protein
VFPLLSRLRGDVDPETGERLFTPTFFFPSAGTVAAPAAGDTAAGGGGEIPFVVGSNLYNETPFSTVVQQLDANSHETVVNITPGGFLRGITMQVTSASGVIGAGVLQADGPYSIISSASLEDISGGAILYPMSGFTYAMCSKYLRPWDGDPTKRAVNSGASINPAFTLRFFVEVKNTLACLANTDARAQYRFRYTLAPGNAASGPFGLTSTAPTTQPTVTVKLYIETWAQPDLNDLLGNTIQQIPDGLVASRFLMHEQPVITNGNNVIRETLTGNELRGLLLIIRNGDTLQTRQSLTDANAGGIQFRQDTRSMWKRTPTQQVETMSAFYTFLANATSTREAGVYVIPRFAGPTTGDENGGQGEYWQQTVEQTLLQLEFNGSDLTTSPGQIEMVYDALAISGVVPVDMEGV